MPPRWNRRTRLRGPETIFSIRPDLDRGLRGLHGYQEATENTETTARQSRNQRSHQSSVARIREPVVRDADRE